jgi:hypothetical protein
MRNCCIAERQALVAYDFRGEHEAPSPLAVTVATAQRVVRRQARLSHDQIAARRSEAGHALVPPSRAGQVRVHPFQRKGPIETPPERE